MCSGICRQRRSKIRLESMLLLPTVSVIMPVRNEEGFIERSLAAVLGQDYPTGRLEVIVADGMSTDGTREIIASVADRCLRVPVRLVDNPGRSVPSGLNRAVAAAAGEVIVRVDGHTVVAPDYVRECVAALGRSGADNVGGRMDAVGEGVFAEAVALATSSPFGVGGARFHYSEREEWVDTVYMGAWRKETLLRLGLFDEEMVRSQDSELNYRLRSRGGRILLSPRIRSHYYCRGTLRSLWRQYFQYGYWKVRVFQKHPRQMQLRQFVAPAFVGTALAAMALSPFHSAGRALAALVLGCYAIANLGASFRIARKRGWVHLPLLPVVFGTIHAGWGLGFLAGLARFAPRWLKR